MATINGINPYPNRNENCNLKEAEKAYKQSGEKFRFYRL